jgi:hypothetical protein
MNALKEAGILAFKQLVTKLAPHGYKPAPLTPASGVTQQNQPLSNSAWMILESNLPPKLTPSI